jgi:hypothetical protein
MWVRNPAADNTGCSPCVKESRRARIAISHGGPCRPRTPSGGPAPRSPPQTPRDRAAGPYSRLRCGKLVLPWARRSTTRRSRFG